MKPETEIRSLLDSYLDLCGEQDGAKAAKKAVRFIRRQAQVRKIIADQLGVSIAALMQVF